MPSASPAPFTGVFLANRQPILILSSLGPWLEGGVINSWRANSTFVVNFLVGRITLPFFNGFSMVLLTVCGWTCYHLKPPIPWIVCSLSSPFCCDMVWEKNKKTKQNNLLPQVLWSQPFKRLAAALLTCVELVAFWGWNSLSLEWEVSIVLYLNSTFNFGEMVVACCNRNLRKTIYLERNGRGLTEPKIAWWPIATFDYRKIQRIPIGNWLQSPWWQSPFFSRTYSIDEWGTGIIRILFENGLPKESNRVISAFFLHLNGNFFKHSHVSDSWVVDLIIIPVFVPTRFTLSRMLFHVWMSYKAGNDPETWSTAPIHCQRCSPATTEARSCLVWTWQCMAHSPTHRGFRGDFRASHVWLPGGTNYEDRLVLFVTVEGVALFFLNLDYSDQNPPSTFKSQLGKDQKQHLPTLWPLIFFWQRTIKGSNANAEDSCGTKWHRCPPERIKLCRSMDSEDLI